MQLGGKQCRRCHREHFCVWWNWPSHYLLTVGECLNLRQPPTFLPTSRTPAPPHARTLCSCAVFSRWHRQTPPDVRWSGNRPSPLQHDLSNAPQMVLLFSYLLSLHLLLIQHQCDLWPDLFKQAFRSGQRVTLGLTKEHKTMLLSRGQGLPG